ncbi:unnamed protein product, partial [Brassica oleracea]
KVFDFCNNRIRLGVSSSSVRQGEERVVIREEDMISSLPDPLLCHILSFLTIDEAVWTSVLSSRWRHLWKWVPRLELDSSYFPSDKVCVDFIDEFLAFQGKSYLREFKLTIDHDVFYSDVSLYEPCLGRVDMRKIERFQVENRFEKLSVDNIATPLTLSACEALVCLKLHFVRLNEFVSLSLPCLKIMYLEDVVLPSDAAAEALISSSQVLEVLKISLSRDDVVVALRVCSTSLKSFTLKGVERCYVCGHYSVLIDAPKLEYLSLMDYYHFRSFEITSMAADSVKVDIDVEFMLIKGYLSETKMIYNLVKSFSGAEDLTISWKSLEFIYSSFHRMKRPPKLHDLTVLRATMCLYASPKLLPVVLESCPNLKHLTLELVIDDDPDAGSSTRLSTVLPRCLVSSLESVEMESPVTEIATELKLARYFMKNSTTLKKLVLRLNDCTLKPCVLEQLVKSSKRFGLSQFEVIPVVPTPNPRPEGLGVSSSSVREEEERVVIRGEDMISSLPEPLLCHILSFLTTEQAVQASVLSSRWRHIWRWVPRLELDSSDFTDNQACGYFIDKFLAFQGKNYLREFKLTIDHDIFGGDASLYEPCLSKVDMRKLERFQVENTFGPVSFDDFPTPLTLSVCEALVCLKLHYVRLNDDLKSLSLPCLKIMFLEDVVMPSDAAAEALISCSPVLEVLKICLSKDDFVVALRVCSPSLKSFTLKGVERCYVCRHYSVLIDAPKLEYLSLMDYYHFRSFEITSAAESFKVDIDVDFAEKSNFMLEMMIIYSFLNNFSGVKDMTMSWRTLQFIYEIHRMSTLPKFHDLTRLRATVCLNASPELLPMLLESCPNLKHLTLELFIHYPVASIGGLSTVRLPRCLVSSLESVEIESPVTEEATELDLARCFMRNSTTLKKLVLRLNESSTGVKHKPCDLEQLLEFSKRYGLSQFEVLPVVPTPNPLPPGLGVYSSSVREGGERAVVRGEDLISLLPEPLLCHILSFLTTEQAVRTSVLSSRWRNIWKWVPRLELDSFDFTNDKVCVDFIDKFLALQGKPYLREFKLTIDHDVFGSEASLYEPCLGRVDMRKLERFQVENKSGRGGGFDDFRTPLTLSACEALVCLKLHFVSLNDDLVSLSFPCLKIMFLEDVVLPSDAAAEALISSSPVLEVLKICLSRDDFVVALRVCSPSLKSFTLKRVEPIYPRGHSVLIDAPKLEYLSLVDYYHFRSFEIISKAESFKVDVDVEFELLTDYLAEKKIVYNLLDNFSGVKDMTMSWKTLQFIYSSHGTNPLPKFHGLTRLRATMRLNASPELLPVVLESCPNLKHLTLELFFDYPIRWLSELSTVLPSCLVSSLESVEMESPVTEVATELDLARYFMKNSTTLKKLVLRLDQSSGEQHKPGVLEQLKKYSRRYGLSRFEVLPVVPTPNPLPPGSGVSSRSAREGEERAVISGEEDRISSLPDPLLCHILSFLTTEQAVRTNVLSSRWRNIWKWVPRLELDSFDFTNDKVCVDFIDKFLAFQGKSYLREFKLTIDHDVSNSNLSLYGPCLGRVVDMRKLERFQVGNEFEHGGIVYIRFTLSASEALVSLKLHSVWLNGFKSLSFPSLKIMFLEDVGLPSDAAAEELISCSPVLQVLKICLCKYDSAVALRVCSLSLKSFTLKRMEPRYSRGHSVVIDAPKLGCLSLTDYYHFSSFEITSVADSFKVDIDVEFELMSDYLMEMKIIYNLLKNFSGVTKMTISWKTLEFIYSFHQTNPVPKFHDLTCLRAIMCLNASPKLLPIVLESCPNLKHLTLIASMAADSFKVDIDVEFELMTDYLSELKIIYNLVKSFLGAEDMTISWRTLLFIHSSPLTNFLPKFHGLTRLRATMCLNASPELLPIVLESCPNVKHFDIEVIARLSTVLSRCLVSSLESVEMECPVTEIATELDLARYFMKNSTTLKKLVLRLNQSSTGEKHRPGVLDQLIESPRLSSLCQFEVIPVVVFSLKVKEKAMQGGRSGTSGEDRISILPEPLLCHILTFLTTKESVRSSVLSSRWRDLWLWVPRLDLDKSDFSEENTCVSFIDKFLNFRGESYLRGFKLNTDHDDDESNSSVEACLTRVVNKCKIQHFEIKNYFGFCYLEMSLVFSMCDTLVSLKLSFVMMSDYDQSCSLPCLKSLHLEKVVFPSDETAEALISSSPVLKDLKMSQSEYDSVQVLRVRSKSLKSFTLERADPGRVENSLETVVVDTPGLEYLNLINYQYTSFQIVSLSESVKFDIDVVLSSTLNILTFVSHARDMTISRRTLEFIYYHLEINRRSKFHGLARLRATMFSNSSPAMLPVILEACPNLKHLTLELVHHFLVTEGTSRLLNLLPPSLISSLETVDIESPVTDKATELELVRYFLENSTRLKKIVLRLNQSCRKNHKPGFLKQLVEYPRCSGLCQFVILHC